MSIKSVKFGAREQRFALLGLLLFTGFIFLFSKLPARIAAMESQRKYEGEFYEFAQLFSEIYGDIQDRYVKEVDSKKIFEAAVRGMFAALEDPHSQWLSPDSLTQLEKDTEGEFSGVGLNITLQQGVLTVIAPIPGTPAAKAGMLPMDRIVEIDGKSTEGITLLEAVKKLTGITGSEVKVKVFREGMTDYLNFSLIRDTIKVDSVFHKILDGDLGYLRISKFSETTADDVKSALEEFNKEKIKGILVDLRYDSGGLLDKAVEISNFFLPKGQLIVSTKGRKEDNNREFRAQNDQLCDVAMVVLVNKGSASASEIFAGAMQDTKRGFIVGPKGEKTFGKGSVQTISYLKHSLERKETGETKLSGLRLTTALYYTPSGRTIHNIGITPDFEVPLTKEQAVALVRHGLIGDPDTSKLEIDEPSPESDGDAPAEPQKPNTDPKAPPKAETKPKKDAEPKEFHDVMLEEAIKYLRMTLTIEQRVKA